MDETTSHAHGHRPFLPAMGRFGAPRYYDALGRLVGLSRLYTAVADVADARGTVVDVGCGTGALLRRVGRDRPDAGLLGVDPDERMLATARRKAARSRDRAVRDARWVRGYAEEIPAADGTCDRVLSSLMFHHLDPAGRTAMLAEVRRVLRPGGALVLADLDHTHGPARRSPMATFRAGDLPALLTEAGFAVRSERRVHLLLGGVLVLRAEPV